MGFDPATIERVDRMVAGAEFKRQVPADREARAADGGRRLPLSAPATGLGQGVSDAPASARRPCTARRRERRHAVRRRDADRQPRRRHAAGARGAAGGAADRGRGHAASRAGCSPGNGIATRMTSYHAHSAGARVGGPARASADRARPGARHRCRHARGQRPGRRAGRGLGGRRGAGRARCPGASAVLAAVAATGIAGPRWSFEGFLPRSGRERRERAGPDRRRRPRGSLIYEAPGRVAATLRDLAAACGAGRRRRRLSRADQAATRRSSGARSASSRPRRPTGASRHAASSSSWSASGRPTRSPAWPPTRRRPPPRRRAGRRARRGRAPRRRRHAAGRGGPPRRRRDRDPAPTALWGRLAPVASGHDRPDPGPAGPAHPRRALAVRARRGPHHARRQPRRDRPRLRPARGRQRPVRRLGDRDPRARLGRRPLDRAARLADRPAGRRHPERDLRQHRRADHRVLRPPGRPHRRGQGVADRLDHRQPAARARGERARRRPAPRHPDLLRQGGRGERRAARGRRHRAVHPGDLRVQHERARPGIAHRGIGPGRRGPHRRLRALARVPVHEPAADARWPRRAGGPRRAAVDRPHGDRRPADRGRPARRPLGDPRRFDRGLHRAVRPDAVLRGRRAHPDDRQPRRAPRRGPARGEGQDGVRDGGRLRVEPAGGAVRGAGAGHHRGRHRPADEPRVHAARGGGRRRRPSASARSSPSTASRTGSKGRC